jgi:Family of unknown function (DUF5317)
VTLVLGVLILAVAAGLLTGGRIERLSALRIRWAPMALVGLALQYFSPSRGAWPYALLLLSFVLLAGFAAMNLKVAGFTLILAGVCMNFLVIAVNHGMPVTEHALVASGQQDTYAELVLHGGQKHHLAGPDDHLLFLGDVTPIPPPIHQVVSAGDIVAYVGVAWVVVAAMRRRELAPGPEQAPQLEGAGGG